MKWTLKVVSTLELVIRLRQLPALKILFSSGKSTSTNCGDMMLLQLAGVPDIVLTTIGGRYEDSMGPISIGLLSRKRVRWLGAFKQLIIYDLKLILGTF
jgi:hypothetical protein